MEREENFEEQMSLIGYSVQSDNLDLIKFLITIGAQQQVLLATDEGDSKCYTIEQDVFYCAIKLGRTAILAEMIKVGWLNSQIGLLVDSI
jgi:hypothetical protein